MDSGVPIQAAAILILVLLSAFFSSAETSMTTVNRIRIQALAQQGDKRAITLEKVISNSSKMLSTILIGNNIVNMAVSSLMTTLTIRVLGNAYVGLATGALTLVIAGLFPPIGAFFSTLPSCVLGGCTVIMFGAIIVSGVTMLGQCGLDQRNTLIAAASFAIGIGVTQVDGFFSHMPQVVGDIFSGNPVAGVFVVSMILSLALPKKVDLKGIDALTEETLKK